MDGRILRASLGAAVLGVLLTGCIGFTVQKDVDGEPPDDAGPWVVRVECTSTDPAFDDLVFDGEEFQFTQFFVLGATDITCTIDETEDADADEVTIECVDPLPTGVTCTEADDDEITVTVTGIDPGTDININVKVTNEFDPPTTTSTTTTTAPPVTAPSAVSVSPTFTG
jgi:hypothetical protein